MVMRILDGYRSGTNGRPSIDRRSKSSGHECRKRLQLDWGGRVTGQPVGPRSDPIGGGIRILATLVQTKHTSFMGWAVARSAGNLRNPSPDDRGQGF